jgi:hypothetical protein
MLDCQYWQDTMVTLCLSILASYYGEALLVNPGKILWRSSACQSLQNTIYICNSILQGLTIWIIPFYLDTIGNLSFAILFCQMWQFMIQYLIILSTSLIGSLESYICCDPSRMLFETMHKNRNKETSNYPIFFLEVVIGNHFLRSCPW